MSLYRNIHAKRKRIKAGSGEKMRKMGWKQTISLKEGLEETIKWFTYLDNLKFYNPNKYVI